MGAEETNYTKRTVYGAVILFVTSIVAALFAYLFRLLLARELTLEDYGFFFALVAFFSIVNIFRDLGISEAAVFFIPRIKDNKSKLKSYISKTLKIGILLSSICTLIIILMSKFLTENYFHHGSALIIILFAIAYFINSIELSFQTFFNALQHQTIYAMQNLVRNLFLLVGAFITFFYISNILGLIISNIFVYFIILIIALFVFFNKIFPGYFRLKTQKIDLKNIFSFGISATIAYVGFLFMTSTDTLMLTYFTTLDKVGLYNAAVPIISLMLLIPAAAVIVLLPLVSELWVKKKTSQIIFAWEKATKYVFVVVIPIVGILWIYPELVINILFGERFVSASSALSVLAIGGLFYSVALINTSFLMSIDGPKKNIITYCSAAVINIILNLILITKYGILGAAIATAISYMAMFVISNIYLTRIIKEKFEISKYVLTIFAALGFMFVVNYLKKLIVLSPIVETGVIVFVSGLIYLGLIFLFKVITISEIKEIKRKIFEKD